MAEDRERYPLKDRQKDAHAAFTNAKRYYLELNEIWQYFTPFRRPIIERTKESGKGTTGDKRTNQVFDGTGISGAFAFAANMKADWMPAFDDFFKLQSGPLYFGKDVDQRNEQLQKVAEVVHGLTAKIRATATDEMFTDLFAGTGAMVLRKGDVKRDPIRGFAVPTAEIAIDNGPFGDGDRVYWRRTWKARQIEEMFEGRVRISDALHRVIKHDREAPVEVTQYTYWDDERSRYVLSAWTNLDLESEIYTEATRANPWIIPRMFVVPGETFGRGLAHLGLPFVKTANKARELALRAAAFALLGLWTRRHDGVFNPDTASMIPGAMWKVASNGSSGLGKSIERLDIPHNFDVSSIIIKDEREQIRKALLDDELPELADRVRSPTEIAARRRRYDRNRGGATTRLAFELITPFVQRSVDILGEHGLLPGTLEVDTILTQAVVAAPAAAAQKSDKVERITSWLQIMTGLFGSQVAALNAQVEAILPELGRYMGVDEKFIRKRTEADQLKMLIDQAVRQALEAQKGAPPAAQQPPPEDAQAQQMMNGGF